MCICLFHKRAGQYTIEEFHHAIDQYKRTGDHPKTYVYARALVEGEVEEEELKQFKEELFRQMGHYWCNYATEDSMKLHFIMQFERLINDSLGHREDNQNLSIEQGNVMLHGRKVADYNNIPFAANNTEVIALKEKIAFLDKSIAEIDQVIISLKQTIADFMDLIGDENHPKILARIEERNEKQIERNAKADERHQCQEQLEQLEKQLLDTALSISKMISSGHPISERKRAAIEMFEQGNNKGVLEMLNEEEIERDYQSAKSKLAAGKQLEEAAQKVIQAAQDEIRSLVDEYLLKAKTWMSTYSEENRFDEACKCYEQAIALTRESLTEENLAARLFEYGKFLQDNNQYHRVEVYYQEALKIREQLAAVNPHIFESDLAFSLHQLAVLYYLTQRFDLSETFNLQALEIRQRLVVEKPQAHEQDMASSLHNLALLYSFTRQFNKAEEFYLQALKIVKRQTSDNPQAYELHLAKILSNLADVYANTQRLDKAEDLKLQSLELYKHLTQNHPKIYEAELSDMLSSLALLYFNTQRFKEAEKYLLKSLEIDLELAKDNPQAYEPNLATGLTILAILYHKTQRTNEVDKCSFQAVKILKGLVRDNPLNPLVLARSYVNLSYLYLLQHNFSNAETYSREALRLFDDHGIYSNLAAAILLQGRFAEAKEIYMQYKDEIGNVFLSDLRDLKDNNAIPEHIIGDVEKIIELLNS
jgi:tetratricopeptide (TPR) repeat protein